MKMELVQEKLEYNYVRVLSKQLRRRFCKETLPFMCGKHKKRYILIFRLTFRIL